MQCYTAAILQYSTLAENCSNAFSTDSIPRPKKKDSCVQVSEVKKIRVGRKIFLFWIFFFITNVQKF